MSIWPVAVVTFLEGIRTRAIYEITVLALLMMVGSNLLSGMIMQEVGKVMIDFALSTVAFSGLLVVLFVGINLMAKDIDRRTVYMVLSRPMSRTQYLFGKFLGILLLIVVTVFVVGVFAVVAIFLTQIQYPDYFTSLSWGAILIALFMVTLSLILLAALTFLYSSFVSSSFLTLVLTIVSYLIGHGINDVKELVEAPGQVGIEVAPSTVKIIQGVYYLFPNLSFFDFKTAAAHNLPIPLSTVFWTTTYGFCYTAIVMILASLIFARREFS